MFDPWVTGLIEEDTEMENNRNEKSRTLEVVNLRSRKTDASWRKEWRPRPHDDTQRLHVLVCQDNPQFTPLSKDSN